MHTLSTFDWIIVGIVAWVVLSVPIGILVGRMLRGPQR